MQQSLIEQAKDEIKKHKLTVESDCHRLRYHLMPPVGLLNDPNGFIQWKGTYHLFYQWMPFNTEHGAKFWGHYSSTDLVTWNSEPIALAPTDWFDKNGCYSGSAIVDGDKLKLFYTGNVKDAKGSRETYQCVAESIDGVEFEKLGVVMTLPEGYTAHFRDPKVWKKGDCWYLIIGAQSKDLQGKAVLFKSKNLKEWTHLGIIAGSNENDLGEFGFMWECPDLFKLDGEDVLLVSPQGLQRQGILYHNKYQTGYFVGKLDYDQVTFLHSAFTELDRGFEFYAPQTTLDESGRRLLFAWMGVPDQDEDKHPTVEYKWIHAMTLPRELKLKDGKMYQSPVAELKALRESEVSLLEYKFDQAVMELDGVNGKSLELEMIISEEDYNEFSILFRNYARFQFDRNKNIATLERPSFVNGEPEKRQCKLEKLEKLTVYLDTSSIEIFLNEGEEVFTARIFPEEEDTSIFFQVNGTILANVRKWEIKGKRQVV